MKMLLCVALCLLALFGATGWVARGADGGDAGKFIVQALNWQTQRQYGRVWRVLDPRYRRAVARSFWEACQRRQADALAGVEWESFKATDSYRDTITLPLLGRVHVTAVTVQGAVQVPRPKAHRHRHRLRRAQGRPPVGSLAARGLSRLHSSPLPAELAPDYAAAVGYDLPDRLNRVHFETPHGLRESRRTPGNS